MENRSPIIGTRAIRHIASGIIVTEPAPIFEEDWPFRNLPPEQPLLRYMDFYKFLDLFETQTLYFSRVDQFKDHLEGSISPEGIHGTSASDIAYNGIAKIRAESYDKLVAQQELAKRCTFVNCWHINDGDTQQMWNAYTETGDSVLVISSAGKLAAALKTPVFSSCVKYVKPEMPKTHFDERSAFFYKDEAKFSFEREFRLLIDLGILPSPVYKDDPKDFYRKVPVDLSILVHSIKPHPFATSATIEKINNLVNRYLPNAIQTGRCF